MCCNACLQCAYVNCHIFLWCQWCLFFFWEGEQVRHYHLKGAIGVKRLQTVGSERNVEFLCSLRPWPVKLYDAKFQMNCLLAYSWYLLKDCHRQCVFLFACVLYYTDRGCKLNNRLWKYIHLSLTSHSLVTFDTYCTLSAVCNNAHSDHHSISCLWSTPDAIFFILSVLTDEYLTTMGSCN